LPTLLSIAIVAAVLLALAAFLRARAAVKRLERLSESYWELRYESGQLKSRVTRLEVAAGLRDPEPEADAPRAASTTTFVPLSSLKK
jgi:hypothetical protein